MNQWPHKSALHKWPEIRENARMRKIEIDLMEFEAAFESAGFENR